MAQIKTYARLKPTKKPYSGYEINRNVLTVHIPDNRDMLVFGSHQTVRSNLSYDIVFTDIFRPESSQEDVFDGVAKGIIQSFLNGYNGTIFAYGQTGTGKTYTVEGNSTGYNTRGLSTRALSMIYQQLENRLDDHITVCLSYLEIYQEVAYDLLNPTSRSSLPMAPFAKVTVVEGPRGSCIFRGLSLHLAANEEIAQMLLLQGQANRKVAETPVNQRSSRSHAVFTVYLQVRKRDSDVLLNSKLHLVDLAGSERVSKTGVDGQQLTEAKSINLSLHHLETVIIALQTDRSTSSSSTAGGDKSKVDNLPSQSRSNTSFMSGPSSDSGTKPYKYVPYRNSLLTMVLKDSLGGNCLTAMIATISMEPENLGESISTCRFAQRVARIANNARRNEEVDDKTVIKRLKHKVANLEHELSVLRSKIQSSIFMEEGTSLKCLSSLSRLRKPAGRSDSTITDEDILSVLTEDDRTTCAKIMEGFLQGVITDPVDAGIYDQSRFRECLKLLKRQYLHSLSAHPQHPVTTQHLQLPTRQVVVDHSSEVGHQQLQPNNPHRDSGDHNMSDATQADSSLLFSQQRPPAGCTSVIHMHATPDGTLAFEDHTTGATGIAVDTEKRAAEKRGTEFDQYLETTGNEKGRCLHERQNMKELKKPSHKLTALEQEQAMKQEHLTQMSQNILMQELLAAENNLRLKLQVVEEQVAEQHAYIMQLKLSQVDMAQIAREQLVEQHLLKRQTKFRAKLNKLLENKSKLQYTLANSRDTNSSVYAGHNRMSAEDKFNQFKQGKTYHSWQKLNALRGEEKDLYMEPSPKLDRDMKLKQVDKELMIQDKIREYKQKLKMCQKLAPAPVFEVNVDKQPPQNSKPVDSNRSLRGSSCPSSCVNSGLENSGAIDLEAIHENNKTCPSNASSQTFLQPKDFSEGTHTIEPQAKYVDEYVVSGSKDKANEDYRQGKYNASAKSGEANKRYESSGPYSVRNITSPDQQSLNSSALVARGDVTDNATQENQSALVELSLMYEAKPMEVRSFHDPHHSHKFALDDMPAECMALSNPRDDFNNKNNSYLQFVRRQKQPHVYSISHSTNSNMNANTSIHVDVSTDTNTNIKANANTRAKVNIIIDASTNTSANAYVNTNIDANINTNTNANTSINPNINTNTDANKSVNPYINTNTDANTSISANINTNANTSVNPYINTNTNANTSINPNINTNTDANTSISANINTNTDANTSISANLNTNTNANTSVNPNINTNTDANTSINPNINTNTDAKTITCAKVNANIITNTTTNINASTNVIANQNTSITTNMSTNTNANINTNANKNSSIIANTKANTNPKAITNANANTNTSINTNANTNTSVNTNANSNINVKAITNTSYYTNTKAKTNAFASTNTSANTNASSNTNANASTNANANTNAIANTKISSSNSRSRQMNAENHSVARWLDHQTQLFAGIDHGFRVSTSCSAHITLFSAFRDCGEATVKWIETGIESQMYSQMAGRCN